MTASRPLGRAWGSVTFEYADAPSDGCDTATCGNVMRASRGEAVGTKEQHLETALEPQD
jgi:hypothetical protein